ncbi:hypothetical protein BU24DRAFT_446962 [Aaosphaeria arxii CBS 175.79]|uniref:Uncharacterized protein n=1 Tax=Aaosphaeria arxii CBS 175.79 TaxID=1450172 RepID=A0A6A5Y9U0_9PLEO|nr:uncharacterized protein BU24DRAFT_446962 [Aaosphaeria arxii CBS 175.79]KAF2022099.1 hypothetical protein BU24DRAFT_446962 [Aaosphaeria arxii CBS 175.79]
MPHYDVATRVQVVTLLSMKTPPSEIQRRTGMAERSQYNLLKKAKQRGWDGTKILAQHVEDAPRSGAPRGKRKKKTLEKLGKDQDGGEETSGSMVVEPTDKTPCSMASDTTERTPTPMTADPREKTPVSVIAESLQSTTISTAAESTDAGSTISNHSVKSVDIV